MRSLAIVASMLAGGAALAAAAKVGDRAVDFTLPDLGGQTVQLSSLRGSVVVVDFWASWCVPCRKELPALDVLARRYADGKKPVVFLAVGIDKERANATKFLSSAKISAVRILLDPDGKIAAAYDLPTMPSSYVIDAKGLVRHVHSGFSPGDEKAIAQEIDGLLKSE